MKATRQFFDRVTDGQYPVSINPLTALQMLNGRGYKITRLKLLVGCERLVEVFEDPNTETNRFELFKLCLRETYLDAYFNVDDLLAWRPTKNVCCVSCQRPKIPTHLTEDDLHGLDDLPIHDPSLKWHYDFHPLNAPNRDFWEWYGEPISAGVCPNCYRQLFLKARDLTIRGRSIARRELRQCKEILTKLRKSLRDSDQQALISLQRESAQVRILQTLCAQL